MLLYDSDEYRASKDWPYAVAAGCVVYEKDRSGEVRVLLLTRNYEHDVYSAGNSNRPSYHLPKGHINHNETLESAAMRETEEEMGAIVKIEGYIGSLHHDFNHPTKRNTTDKIIHYFAARYVKDGEKSDNEHDGREWVDLSKAEELLSFPNTKGEDEIVHRLKKFLELSSAT